MGLKDRLAHAWNAFVFEDKRAYNNRYPYDFSQSGNFSRPDRTVLTRGNERSIITSIYNRIALDCSNREIRHVKVDENGRYTSDVKSGLNTCLSIESNKDQIPRAFIQDIVMSLFDEGAVAVVPIDTNININEGSFDILSMRVGKIVEWMPDHIKVNVYNDKTGNKQDIVVPKKTTAIIENPLYSVMNERNSIFQRLIRKLNLLDIVDEQSGSGKLDLIIQLPYVLKSDARKQQAEQRRQDITNQLQDSKYGIVYTDGSEKITQLNRTVENNLLKQVEYLITMVFTQLGVNEKVLDGTANEETMINYYNRIVEPIVDTIVDEFNRKFLSKTARTQGHKITYFNNAFQLVPVSKLADIADKFTRNEILTSNELRDIIGFKPSKSASADELRNKNMPVTESNQQINDGELVENGSYSVLYKTPDGKTNTIEIEADSEMSLYEILEKEHSLTESDIYTIIKN